MPAGQHLAIEQDAATAISIAERVDAERVGEQVLVVARAAFEMVVAGEAGEGVVAAAAVEMVPQQIAGALQLVRTIVAKGNALARPDAQCVALCIACGIPGEQGGEGMVERVRVSKLDDPVQRVAAIGNDGWRVRQCVASVDHLQQQGAVVQPLAGEAGFGACGCIPVCLPGGIVRATGCLPQRVERQTGRRIGRVTGHQCQGSQFLQSHQRPKMLARQSRQLRIGRQDPQLPRQGQVTRVRRGGGAARNALNRRMQGVALGIVRRESRRVDAQEGLHGIHQVLEAAVLPLCGTAQQGAVALQRQARVELLQQVEDCQRIGDLALVVVVGMALGVGDVAEKLVLYGHRQQASWEVSTREPGNDV